MTPNDNFDWLLDSYGPDGDAEQFFALGRELEQAGQLELAATAFDRAYGLNPTSTKIQEFRQMVLDELAVEENGIHFRYIPAGTFLMGSEDGDDDEKPVHPVKLDSYWLSETPLSWAKFCELMKFYPPPAGYPDEDYDPPWISYSGADDQAKLNRREHWLANLVLVQDIQSYYCEHKTGETAEFNEKPMVAVEYEGTQALSEMLTNDDVEYRLPTEAEWEKAARGGLIGAAYAWGNEPPTHDTCDFGNFRKFAIQNMKAFPPNGYGLYAMCGGVWEWVSDLYDAQYYASSPRENPTGPSMGEEHVLRGGAWTDDPEAVTVSFRMSYKYSGTPTIGFRLCRVNRGVFP